MKPRENFFVLLGVEATEKRMNKKSTMKVSAKYSVKLVKIMPYSNLLAHMQVIFILSKLGRQKVKMSISFQTIKQVALL